MKKLLTRSPITAFFVLAFAGTWLPVLPLVLSQNGLRLYWLEASELVFGLPFIFGTFTGPTLAALLVTWALEGRQGLVLFLRRYGQWRVGLRWFLLVVFAYPLLYLLASTVLLGASPWQNLLHEWPRFFTAYLPGLLVFPALITWGEEPGWRGFALTRMQPIYGPLKSSLSLGFLHALWHLPIFLMTSGPVASGPFNPRVFAFNTLAIMLVTVLWTFVFNRAGGSILIAVLLHASSNATPALIMPLVPATMLGNLSLVSTAIYALLVLAVVLLTRGRLGYSEPLRTPEMPSQPKQAVIHA
jgi:uncharacterized protein